jgi:hypothetical protein
LQGLALLAAGLLLFYLYIHRTLSARHKNNKPKRKAAKQS